MDTMVGAQASQEQQEKILSYLTIGASRKARRCSPGARRACGRARARKSGFYIEPTILKGHNRMRVFQEEIFGPVVSVTTFRDEGPKALAIA